MRPFNSLVVAIRRHAEQSVERVRRAVEHALEEFRNGCGGGGGGGGAAELRLRPGCMNGGGGEQLDELALFGAARMINAARVELDLELADDMAEERREASARSASEGGRRRRGGARARRSRDHNADFYLVFAWLRYAHSSRPLG